MSGPVAVSYETEARRVNHFRSMTAAQLRKRRPNGGVETKALRGRTN
jgi:hypothetical protein